jgi:hypothetical protein
MSQLKANLTTANDNIIFLYCRHCSVLVNASTVIVVGGYHDDLRSANTFFYEAEKKLWMEGPSLKHKRSHHSCGRIRRAKESQE